LPIAEVEIAPIFGLMIAEKFPEIADLPMEDKRLLISELCEEVAGCSEAVNPAIARILEQRWKDHTDDPAGAVTLEEFRKRIGVS